MTIDKIAVIGAGSWGTAVAFMLGQKGFNVVLRARRAEITDGIRQNHRNAEYLSEVRLPDDVGSTADLPEALKGADVIVFAVPSHAIRETCRQASALIRKDALLISLAKGLEAETFMRMSEVIAQEMPESFADRIAVLSGPNHAEEVSKMIPSATVVASTSVSTATFFQDLFMTPFFRVYQNSDLVGVEIGGASKNVIAVAAGMSDGLGFGDNTKASLMTRGLAEMTRLGVAVGALPVTFSGLSGMGDLIATCISRHSRNRGTGEKIAMGKTVAQIQQETTMIAEGIVATKVIDSFAVKLGIELPITHNVFEVLYQGKDPHQSVNDLMTRGPNTEG